ncbi:MAG TPA: DegT/DnrJ/EryC1/StrS family aminotransferase [Solirubrobacteraceae bacterium]|jgi:dTDP-4-amino-4,6-dideoxygalactose transaminase
MAVPLFDPQSVLRPLRGEIMAAIEGVVDGGQFVLGPQVEAFESDFAAFLGARRVAGVAGVANGTEAITIALRALGVGPGDEVVVPSFTFYASAEAIPPTGATPVFCDIDLDTLCVTPETVKAALTPRTKAVVVVHLFGNVAPVADIEALGVPVVEDAAQAAGARSPLGHRVGSLGTMATFSFYPSKNLGAFGDGGAVVSRDAELDDRVRTLRFHGSRDKVTYEQVGYNSRLDEVQAAILRVLLPHLDGWSDHRRQVSIWYGEEGLGGPVVASGADPAWHLHVIRDGRGDAVAEALADKGVQARAYYRTPVHRQRAMAPWAPAHDLPATDEAARTHLALPMSASLTREQVSEVAAAYPRAA